jgi:hypothetical protein
VGVRHEDVKTTTAVRRYLIRRCIASLGRRRLRVVLPADLPDCLAARAVSRLRAAADSAQATVT